MNYIDKFVSVFNPQAGVRRAAARHVLESQKRDYAAAGTGRRSRGWRGRSTSATTEVGAALSLVRDRSREFSRNSWAGVRILDVLVSHTIGTGIVTTPNTGSDRADRKYKLAREEWESRSDVERVLDYGGQQALMFRSMVEGGDAVLRMLPDAYDSGGVPFRLFGLEGDYIDSTRDYFSDDSVRLGVKLGQWNRREGLYLHETHPGDQRIASTTASTLVDWDSLCHLYRPLRAGQIRGISWFAPILLKAKELDDLMDAAVVQQRVQASFAGFLKRAPGGANPMMPKTESDTGDRVTQIRPGAIQDIGESEITFANPAGQSVFGESYIAGLRAMAAGAGLTYDQLTGDLTQANYSSLRAGKIEFRRLVEQIQWHIMVPMFCRKVDYQFERYAVLSGQLRQRRGGYNVDYIMPAVEPIDPKKDLEADILAVRAGRMSPQQFITAWGHDWRKVVDDFESFFAFCDDNKITLDIDPRKARSGGASNAGTQAANGDQNNE